MIATESSRIHLTGARAAFVAWVKKALTFPNPRFQDAERMGRFTRNIPRYLTAYEETDEGLLVPRGFGPHLRWMAEEMDLPLRFEDRTRILPEVDFTFNGSLRPYQAEAVDTVLSRRMGTLAAPTGSGKTVMALAVIARRRQPALVVVHTKELLNQWIDRIQRFLGIPRSEIGVVGNGKRFVGPRISVGIVNSIYKCADEIAPMIGFVAVDECHRAPSRTFSEAVTAFDARFLTGLSATPWRRDKLGRLIYWALGDLACTVDSGVLQRSGDILRAVVKWRRTSFETRFDPSEEYSRMLSELTADPGRNELIARDVAQEAKNGNGILLVLTDRKDHVSALSALLEDRRIPVVTLTGDMSQTARAESLEAVKNGSARVLVATQQLVGEGMDVSALATVFLSTPIKFDGRLLQSVGRVLRPAPGKDRALVVDYLDEYVGPLLASARARMRTYEKHGMDEA